jgi:hypothetical protein
VKIGLSFDGVACWNLGMCELVWFTAMMVDDIHEYLTYLLDA